MGKRTAVFFAVMMMCMFLTILRIFDISSGAGLAQTAQQQHSYILDAVSTRGTIYDRNFNALTGMASGEDEYIAAVVPGTESTAALDKILPASKMKSIYSVLEEGRPFVLKLPKKIQAAGIDVFTVKKRYSDTQPAAHIIGYLDGTGKGTSGVEKAFNKQLSENQGRITVTYQVDALNRALAGEQEKISDTSYLKNCGVVLTLDKTVQSIAEKTADKYIAKGAVVIAQVPSCKLLAVVSRPNFSPDNVSSVLKSNDSPLLNRALSAYSVGSVFKLVSAAAALECGISPEYEYTCTGSIDVDGQAFHCFNGIAHGKENMKEAITNSCNTYFINLMQHVPQSKFLQTAQSLGFGCQYEIASGITSCAGTLPSLEKLSVPRALANFSFGQGELTATPLQITAMVNSIASGGKFSKPSLYEGIVNEKLEYTQKAVQQPYTQAISDRTAQLLREFMQASIEQGTSKKGKPEHGGAGAKTATAQTGKFINNVEINQTWFTGFYPYENPKYVITVFNEGGSGGGSACGPAFKQIADELYLAYGLNG